jgi:hypothetical protein
MPVIVGHILVMVIYYNIMPLYPLFVVAFLLSFRLLLTAQSSGSSLPVESS